MVLAVSRGVKALGRAVLAMSLAPFAKQERSDAADGGAPGIPRAKQIISAAVSSVAATSAGVADKAVRHSKSEFKRLGIDVRKEPTLGPAITSWRKQNVERVTTLLEFERDELTGILAKGWGKTVPELRERIQERLEVSRSKAELLARDQVLTLNAQITQSRHVAAGITEYAWTSANDERVRESHAQLDGERFSWDDPPEVDGERVHPGEPVNCRCVAFPILPELED